jgi:hypothetical protein
MLPYNRFILTEEFLLLSSSQCLGNTICLRLTAGGWQLTYFLYIVNVVHHLIITERIKSLFELFGDGH